MINLSMLYHYVTSIIVFFMYDMSMIRLHNSRVLIYAVGCALVHMLYVVLKDFLIF